MIDSERYIRKTGKINAFFVVLLSNMSCCKKTECNGINETMILFPMMYCDLYIKYYRQADDSNILCITDSGNAHCTG